MERRLCTPIWLLGIWLVASCGGGNIPKTNYYTVQIAPPPAATDPKTNLSLGIEHFRAVEVLRDDRIVFYKSPMELEFYQYHRWSTDPATILTELTVRWLSQMGVFDQVRLLPVRGSFDYTLRGQLYNFEEIDYNGGEKGRVALELTLVRTRDRRVVWSALRQSEHPVEGRGVAAVVSALNASSDDVLRQTLPELARQVERDFAETHEHPQ